MSKGILFVVVLIVISVNSVRAEFRTLDWGMDHWNSTNGLLFQYDKVDHFVWMTTTTVIFENLLSQKHGWKYAILFGVANEVKDSIVPFEKYGWIGGEGFSAKDMLANIAGVVAGYYFNKILLKIF